MSTSIVIFENVTIAGKNTIIPITNAKYLQLDVSGNMTSFEITPYAQVTEGGEYLPIAVIGNKDFKIYNSIKEKGFFQIDVTGIANIKIELTSISGGSINCKGILGSTIEEVKDYVDTAIEDGAIQTVSITGGTNNGTIKTIVDDVTTDDIAITGWNTKADEVKIERIKYYGDPDIIPSDESYFVVSEDGFAITGLTEEGKTQTELVIPYKINGVKITTLDSGTGGTSILEGVTDKIIKVILPNSITNIGGNAFAGCYSLTSINIPDSVTSIGGNAFGACYNLASINIPNGVTSIGYCTFVACSSLKSIEIPNGVTTIEDEAFYNCTSLNSIEIPNSVTSIGSDVFIGCTNLTIYCEQGSYAETYAKTNNISIVYTDVTDASVLPTYTSENNGEFLKIVDGSPEWASTDTEPNYKSIELNTAITDIKNGLAKFKLTGLVQPGQYNLAHGSLTDKYVPIQHTMGELCVYENDSIINSFSIELFGRNADSTRGFAEAKDELTEKYYKRVWSNDFFISKNFAYATVTTANSSNTLHKLTIPISNFGDEIPKQTGVLECVCPAGYAKTITELTELSTAMDTYPYFAMEYSEDKQDIYLYILTKKVYTKAAIFNSKLYIKYELNDPIYDYHSSKMYLDNGMKIVFNQKSVDIIDGTVYPSKSNNLLSKVKLTAIINAPINDAAVLDGFEQTSININDLNKRVDNIEVTTAKVGAADGVTDDSDAIQLLINNCENTDGTINEVQIPTGIYALGKSLEITKSNTKLVGLGNVILKPTGNFPAIKIYRPDKSTLLSDVYVDNIKIYLPDAAYLDGSSYNGAHSGIYISGANNGIYRINLSNITVQGVYRYKIRNTDNSYGIYFNSNVQDSTDYGYVYFASLNNIQCFSVYCGLYLGANNNCTTVTNFHFDRGNDIYKKGGRAFTHFGCAYGVICKSTYNTIDLTGQLVGYDNGGFAYFDDKGNEYSLADVVGEDNVIHGSSSYEEDVLDFFNSDYVANVKQYVTYTDSEGKNISLRLKYINLSKTGILCSGAFNTFSGMIFDPQRAYSYIDFTSYSSNNRYYIPTLHHLKGTNISRYTYSWDLDNDGTVEEDQTFTLSLMYIDDKGANNLCVDPVLSQQESLAGEEFVYSADNNGTTIGHAVHHGFQDNCLSFLDKRSTITVKQGEDDVTVNDGAMLAAEAMKEVFDPKSTSYGFTKGITFDQIPTGSSPIVITIEFDEDFTISRLSRFDIKFNDYIARSFLVLFKYSGMSDYTRTSISSEDNTNSLVSTLLYFNKDGTNIEKIEDLKGIKIYISKGYSTNSYNTEGKVGLSYIFGVDSEHGGNTFLPKSGGNLYGDIFINDDRVATETELERIKYYGDKDIIPSDESYFVVNETGETITGLTDEGKTQTELVIPYKINGIKITSIGDSAFINCGDLESIKIPNSVTSIGNNAFNNCYTLPSIEIPNGVRTIGYNAFEDCENLISIKISNSVISIGDNAFSGCFSLDSIEIPNSVRIIGNSAFSGCNSLSAINISNNVRSIKESTFEGCFSLASINIPNKVTTIGNNAFNECYSLTSVIIPNGVTSIGNFAFANCEALSSVEIPKSVTSIGDNAFYAYDNISGTYSPISGLTIYCEQGSYAETYAKENNIPIVYIGVTDISGLPDYTSADEGKVLKIVNGVPTWVSITTAEEVSY